MIKHLSWVLLLTLSVPSHEQDFPPSPCPDVFQYDTVVEQARWYGKLNLTTDSTIYSLWLNIELDEKADILGNWIGDVTTNDNKDFRIENADVKLSPGAPMPVRFFVQYNALNRAPKLKIIRLNGREICNADFPVSATKRPSTEKPYYAPPQVIPVTEKPQTYYGDNEKLPPTIAESNYNNQDQCGMVLKQSPNPLVLGGRATSEGYWPWQVALFLHERSKDNFICGGTLVSRRHVITAAHCVTQKETSRPSPNTLLTVYLGKFKLYKTNEEGEQTRLVSRIISHPEYSSSNHKRDMAILVLHEPVVFTDWVQPACIWPEEDTSLNIIVGKRGSVVGWGYNDTGELADELILAEMPVVDHITCLRSHQFFVQFTSDYTYCAGFRNGTSVCNGDSGGGMVFRINGAWYLRGVVSLSIRSHNLVPCDPHHYVIFTDVAQFLPWIYQYIS